MSKFKPSRSANFSSVLRWSGRFTKLTLMVFFAPRWITESSAFVPDLRELMSSLKCSGDLTGMPSISNMMSCFFIPDYSAGLSGMTNLTAAPTPSGKSN